jgi:hypothetical protein
LIATEGEDLNERISFPVERMEQWKGVDEMG